MAENKILAALVAATREQAQLATKLIDEQHLKIKVYEYYAGLLEEMRPLGYQLVIASGSLAARFRQWPDVTVLELNPDLASLLSDFLALARQGARKIVLLAHENIVTQYHQLSLHWLEEQQIELIMYPVHEDKDIPLVLADGILGKCDAVVTGALAAHYIRQRYPQLLCRTFSLSELSLTNVINAARRILHLEKVKRLQLTRLDLIIDNIQEGIIIFNKKQETVFHNALADKILKDYDLAHWYETLQPLFETTRNVHAVVTLGQSQLLMHTMRFIFPDTDIDNHVVVLQEASAIENNEHSIRRHNITKGLIAKATFDSMILKDPSMFALIERAKLFARTDSTVLIYGETGVGKEVLAQSMHNHSTRRHEPFVSLNCASLPASLIESELFGYAEGAFTGARKQGKKGLFELANKGTIFLDEIGELSLDVQSRLLRVLQEREVMRVGDDKIIPLDVRVICATNRDLLHMAQQGTFRLDLYYRVNVLSIMVPPLRARPMDILELFTTYVKRFLGKAKGAQLNIDPEVMTLLNSYQWPGNIRELRNIAEAVTLYGPHITVQTIRDVMGLNEQRVTPLPLSMDALTLTAPPSNQVSPSALSPLSQPQPELTSPKLPPKLLPELSPELTPERLVQAALATVGNDSLIDEHSGHTAFKLSFEAGFSLRDVEQAVLKELLRHRSTKEVCAMLGINRVTLWRKLKDAAPAAEVSAASEEPRAEPAPDPTTP